jgi:SanA protein
MWRWIKRLVKLSLTAAFLTAALTVACNLWVTGSTAHRIYSSVGEVPYREVGLLLGTSKKVAGGRENLHFTHRMRAAADLFAAGKIDHVLVSGDSAGDAYYDEPGDMLEALVRLGVPAGAITRDGLGVRTLDSVIHAEESWGLRTFTVISDGFHVSRAVFIADQRGLDEVVAFAAAPVGLEKSFKSRLREWLARVGAVLDTAVLKTRVVHPVNPNAAPIVVEKRAATEGTSGGEGAAGASGGEPDAQEKDGEDQVDDP